MNGLGLAVGFGVDVMVLIIALGAAGLFLGYLVLDGLYHRRKWNRMRQQSRRAHEAAGEAEADEPERVPGDR